jgi:hypothetical protein
MMEGYVAIPIRLPTGQLTGYIAITEAKLPKEFHPSNVVTLCVREAPRKFGAFFSFLSAAVGAGRS